MLHGDLRTTTLIIVAHSLQHVAVAFGMGIILGLGLELIDKLDSIQVQCVSHCDTVMSTFYIDVDVLEVRRVAIVRIVMGVGTGNGNHITRAHAVKDNLIIAVAIVTGPGDGDGLGFTG